MSRKASELPEDVKQVCLWLARGYERRKRANQNRTRVKPKAAARERERMEAVEQALVSVGADIQSEDIREQLRAAILLNVESGRAYPYEHLGLEAVSRPDFYRRKSQFLQGIAVRLGLVES